MRGLVKLSLISGFVITLGTAFLGIDFPIQKTAKAIAALDVLASFAVVASRQNYVRPNINERGVIDIRNGRHPVVEQMIPNDMFVANDHDREIRFEIGEEKAEQRCCLFQRMLLFAALHW